MRRCADTWPSYLESRHRSRSCDLPFNSCLLHISWTVWTIFIKLHPNVPLSEVVCRANDSATQTQGQGHTSRSWDLPLNSMSFKSHQPIVRNSLNITQMFLWWVDVQNPWLSYANSKSRSHFKVMGFCCGGYGCPSDFCLVQYDMRHGPTDWLFVIH